MMEDTNKVVVVDMPAVAARVTLKAALLTMRVSAVGIKPEVLALRELLASLDTSPGLVLFVDISRAGAGNTPSLLELDAMAPKGPVRARVVLTRLTHGHVSSFDTAWVKKLGFGGLFPEFDASDCEGDLRRAVDLVAELLSISPLSAAELARCAQMLAPDRDIHSPRSVIRDFTGVSAEKLAAALFEELDIRDRTYLLRDYAQCFVGRDAVEHLVRRYGLAPFQAVAVGQALEQLGLLVHVAHERPFLDGHYFYRIARSERVDTLEVDTVLETLDAFVDVSTKDRTYLGSVYPLCWVGADAVDALVRQHRLRRLDAWLVLHRLEMHGLIEHVAGARPFIDGNYFYRLAHRGSP